METERISGTQVTYLIIGFLLGSSVLFAPWGGAEQEGWLAVLIGLAEGVLFAIVYTALLKRFPRKTIVEIAEMVYGPFLGKLVALAFVGYLVHLGSMVMGNYSFFLKSTALFRTPMTALVLSMALVTIFAVRNGIEVLVRCSQVLVLLIISVFLWATVTLIGDMNPQNLLPLFSVPAKKLLSASLAVGAFPFGEAVAFVMVLPFVNKPKTVQGSVLRALFLSGAIMVLLALRSSMILGKALQVIVFPNYHISLFLRFGGLTRLEILTGINFIFTVFFKISTLVFGSALGTAQLFRLQSYRSLVLPIGVLIGLVSLINFPSMSANLNFAQNTYPVYALPFQFGIPLLTLILAHVRRLPRKGA